MDLPFEFVVIGQPASQRSGTRGKNRWREEIRTSVRQNWETGELPFKEPIKLTVTYFFTIDKNIDTDNFLKPILDALSQLIYCDDRQVTDILCRKRDLNGSPRIINPSDVLNETLMSGVQNFVHIIVEEARNNEVTY